MSDSPPIADDEDAKREAKQHRVAGKLARDEDLRKTFRSALSAALAQAKRLGGDDYAGHLGAELLLDRAWGEYRAAEKID